MCYDTLTKHRAFLDELTEKLIEQENVDFLELQAMIAKYDPERAADQLKARGGVVAPEEYMKLGEASGKVVPAP